MAKSLANQISDVLDAYEASVDDAVQDAVQDVARDAVTKLRETSPKNTGDYAKGWAIKKDGKYMRTIYNKTDWQLTHLLENGHAVKPDPVHPGKKARVEGVRHIAPVEEYVIEELPVKVTRGLS